MGNTSEKWLSYLSLQKTIFHTPAKSGSHWHLSRVNYIVPCIYCQMVHHKLLWMLLLFTCCSGSSLEELLVRLNLSRSTWMRAAFRSSLAFATSCPAKARSSTVTTSALKNTSCKLSYFYHDNGIFNILNILNIFYIYVINHKLHLKYLAPRHD